MTMRLKKHTITINVSSGSGTGVEYFSDEVINSVCFSPPVNGATFDIVFSDNDNIQIFSEEDITAPTDIDKNRLFIGMVTMSITNASEDGVYSVVVYSYEPHG